MISIYVGHFEYLYEFTKHLVDAIEHCDQYALCDKQDIYLGIADNYITGKYLAQSNSISTLSLIPSLCIFMLPHISQTLHIKLFSIMFFIPFYIYTELFTEGL